MECVTIVDLESLFFIYILWTRRDEITHLILQTIKEMTTCVHYGLRKMRLHI